MGTEVEIRAPAEQTEGTRSQILRWLKSIGDTVAEHEPLIEIETDKVTVEVPSPGSGVLREIVKQEQEEIGPGELLGRIVAAGAAAARADATAADGGAAGGAGGNASVADGGAANGVAARTAEVPSGGSSAAHSASHVPGASGGLAAAPARNGAVHHGEGPTGEASISAGAAAGAMARALSPAVRRLLAERGLEPTDVRGTGQGGRVTVEDVLNHSAAPRGDRGAGPGQSPAASTAPVVAGPSPATAVAADVSPSIAGTPSHRVPHSATRKRIAEHMVQSLLHTAPHVTTVFEADLTAVLEHRQRNKDDFVRRGAPLTLTAYFVQATVAAIRAVPESNSRWADTSLEVFDSLHIGIATALETGLVVPVLRDAQSRDLFETAHGLEDLVARARAGRLSPADVRGGTFTISNHGVSGSLVATPIIINQPQSAILGVGKLEKRPVVISSEGVDQIVIRPRCYVSLTIDHRVMDGHQANRFLQTFVEWLANLS